MKRRIGGYYVRFGEPFVIAAKDDDPDGGTYVYPRLWQSDDAIFVKWHFDRDMLDPVLPDHPHGRMSVDGGRTWQLPPTVSPPGYVTRTGRNELTSYWHAFEVPGSPGNYRTATRRSADGGRTWGEMTWTPIAWPGTRGIDIYDPPDGYKHHSANYKGDSQRAEPPAYLERLFQECGTRRRGPNFHMIHTDDNGTLHAFSVARWLPGGETIPDESAFWDALDWTRNAIVRHTSTDAGRSWTFEGRVAFDEHHDITEFDEENCFSEPAMVKYPDGECVCIMRTGSRRPLYMVRSLDGAATWSNPAAISIRGVDPHLLLLGDELLVLATGRPDCTIHFSLDRGKTWPLSEKLFHATGRRRPDAEGDTNSTCNPGLVAVDDETLLYVHDVSRNDPSIADRWLRHSAHARVIGRLIHVERSALAACVSRLAGFVRMRGADAPARLASVADIQAVRCDRAPDEALLRSRPSYSLVDVETGACVEPAGSFRVAWADGALHLSIHCDEPDTKRLRDADPELFWESDTIEVLVRTQGHSYYQFAVSPDGRMMDIDRKNGMNLRWSSHASVVTHIGERAWRIDLRLPSAGDDAEAIDPLAGIAGHEPTAKEPWFINVCRQRVVGERRELSAYVPTGDFGFHLPLTLARLYVTHEQGNQQ